MSAEPGAIEHPQDTPETPLLQAQGISCFRGDRLLFSGVDLALEAGDALQIHGPNGSGKTTMLRILCGLTLPTEGEVIWRGRSIDAAGPEYYEELLYIGHLNGVKLELTPVENLRFARALEYHPSGIALEAALERVNLYGFEDVPARTLSAGQRRRIALARLLISNATLWILDEPFTSLDRAGTAVMESILHEHLERGGIAVLTSHQPVRVERGRAKELHLFS